MKGMGMATALFAPTPAPVSMLFCAFCSSRGSRNCLLLSEKVCLSSYARIARYRARNASRIGASSKMKLLGTSPLTA